MKPLRPFSLLFAFAASAVMLPAASEPTLPPALANAGANKNAATDAPAPVATAASVSPVAGQPTGAPAAAKPSAAAPSKIKDKDAPAKGPIAPPLSPRFQQVRDRIDALLQNRNSTPPPPDPRLSPFRSSGSAPGAVTSVPGVPGLSAATDAPNNDLTVLQQAVATLKVRGVFQMKNGRYQLVINSGANKEGTYGDGAVINVSLQGESAHIRVHQITAHSVTFTLNDAELKLSF